MQWLSLSDTRAAVESLERSVKLAEFAAALAPADRDVLAELASAYDKLGDVYAGNGPKGGIGQVAAALESHRSVVDRRKQILALDPADLAATVALARAYLGLGDDLEKTGDREGAIAQYHEATRLLEPRGAGSTDTRVLRLLSLSYSRTGDALVTSDRPREALAYYRRQFALVEPMALADASDVDIQTRLIMARASIGNALMHSGAAREGLTLLQKSLDEASDLFASAGDALDRSILAFVQTWVGEAEEAAGDLRNAFADYSQAFQRYAAITAADSEDFEDRIMQGAVSSHLTRVLIKQRRANEAAEQSGKTIDLVRSATAAKADDVEGRYALADAYAEAGAVAELQARTAVSASERTALRDAAARSYQASLDVWRKVPNPSAIAPNALEVLDPRRVDRALTQLAAARRTAASTGR